MQLGWLKARQTKYTAYASVYILVILAVLSAANWLANRHNRSYDTTSNKRFSLSDQTAKVVKGLQQDVTITYFDQTSRFPQAKDLLDRYDVLSSRMIVNYVDPDRKPQLAKAAGVTSYGSIFLNANSRREEAKSLSEEAITGALIRALKGGERTACAVSGSGENSLDDTGRSGYSSLKELFEKNNYRTEVISLLEKPEVPQSCTVLLVGGPKFEYLEPAVNAIKTYVEDGGRALLMLDPPIDTSSDRISANEGLASVVEGWGVKLGKELVLDMSSIGQIFGLSEVVPLVTNYEFHPIVQDMSDVATAFPIVRPLEVNSAEKTSVDRLFSTSANSYATSELGSTVIRVDRDKDKKGPFVLGAAGTFETDEEGKQGRFVVVGSSGWVTNYMVSFNGNRDLVMNMMNWLSSDEDLISIRPKQAEDRRLMLSRAQMSLVFYSSVIGLPLFVILAGLSVWWRRR